MKIDHNVRKSTAALSILCVDIVDYDSTYRQVWSAGRN